MEGNQTVNFIAECIKSQSDFTREVYYNICDGTITEVPTGVYDYIIGIPFALILICIAVLAIFATYRMIKIGINSL